MSPACAPVVSAFVAGLLVAACTASHSAGSFDPDPAPPPGGEASRLAMGGPLLDVARSDADGERSSVWTRAAREPLGFRWPERFWAKNYRVTVLWSSAESADTGFAARERLVLPEWSWLEFTGEQRNGRLRVRHPGDGRRTLPREGWVDVMDLMVAPPPEPADLPRAYPATLRPDALRLHVPYRSQLDGTPWAEANCGPTTLGMVLEGFGIDVPSGELRRQVLDAQGIWGHDVGVLMEALARVGESHGARVLDLYDGPGLTRWTLDTVRTHLRAGRPVVLQVRFRALPGRDASPYWGDHFIVVTGLIGDDFLYNDPIDSDGIGYDRLLSSEELQRAMDASDRRYAYAGFALGGAVSIPRAALHRRVATAGPGSVVS